MLINSDFTQYLRLIPVDDKGLLFHSKQEVSYPIGDHESESSSPKFTVHNLPDESNWSNLITVKEFRRSGLECGYKIILQKEYSSPAHLRNDLKELEVI